VKNTLRHSSGILVAIVFGALIFVWFLHSGPVPVRVGESGHLVDADQRERLPDGFVPGGFALVWEDVAAPLVPESVMGVESDRVAQRIARDEIHVRSRSMDLAEGIDLRPPALGREGDAAREWVFDLFEDVRLVGRVERLERHDDERAVYYGSLTNVRGGDFILAYNRGYVAATFHTPGMGDYQIRPHGRGSVAAMEVDLSRLPPCEARPLDRESGVAAAPAAAGIRAQAAIHAMYAASPPPDGGMFGGTGQQGGDGAGLDFTIIDVLIVHTANATAAAGGTEAMGAIIDVTFARANSVFINSEVGVRLRMVRSEEVVYEEDDMEISLDAITDGTGPFASVPAWRNESGADLVALIFDGGGGLAWIYNGNSAIGYSVNGLSGIEATFVHEIGHNLGCLHDRENNSLTPLYDYAFGWRFTPEGSDEMRTIMAYAPGSRVPYFSNPDVTYMGEPTGVQIGEEFQSHNAQVIRQTKASVAAFRSENGNTPPMVVLESPLYGDVIKALDAVTLTALASDSDGTIEEVRFYRLMKDRDFNFSGTFSTSLGADASAPFTRTEDSAPAGFWTYAAVALDNDGGIGVDTVSVTVAPHYRRTILALPGGKSRVMIEGINEAGRIVGYGHNGSTGATDVQAAYWENGTITQLDPLAGDTGARAFAVDQDGVVYGQSISAATVRRAVLWENSTTPTDLSGLVAGFTAANALGVDELGRIYLRNAANGFRRYNNPGSTTPGSNNYWEKVANTGVFAVGEDYDFDSTAWRAMRWNDGGTQLPPLAGFEISWGLATNRSGAVFGISGPEKTTWDGSTARLTFWPAGSTTPIDLGTLGAEGGVARDLNDWNDAVGYAYHPTNSIMAVIWKGGGELIRLADVVLPRAGIKRDAQVINNRGQIAGTGFVGSNQFIYFLDPLPGLDNRYWLARNFSPEELDDEDLMDDGATPSGDGIANLLKRAFGLDPRVPATAEDLAKLPQGELGEDGRFHFSFRRLRSPRDIDYAPELSLDMVPGGWDGEVLEHVETTPLDADFEEVRLRTSFPIEEEDKAFIRLRLSR